MIFTLQVLLFVSQRHFPGFTRLLESGSGQVVARSIPYEGTDVLTHAIIDPNRLKEVSIEHIESMHKSGVHCCVPEYIGGCCTLQLNSEKKSCFA